MKNRISAAAVAHQAISTGWTMLGEKLMTGADEINENPQFSATVITAADFERVWQRATR